MRRTGFLGPKQRVSNIKVRPLQSEGRGFTSVLYELNMEYSPVSVSDSEPLIPPASLVCKVLCPTFAAKVVLFSVYPRYLVNSSRFLLLLTLLLKFNSTLLLLQTQNYKILGSVSHVLFVRNNLWKQTSCLLLKK